MEQKQILMEMYGDIKTLVSEVKAINGDLRETKTQFNEHKKESVPYRKKMARITILFFTLPRKMTLMNTASGYFNLLLNLIMANGAEKR